MSNDTVFPSEPGKHETRFGCLEFGNGECLCDEYNSKATKTYEEKRINQTKLVKAKGLKRGFKNNTLDDAIKNATLYEKTT